MRERTWWVESRRNSESDFEAPKSGKSGFFSDSTQANDEQHAAMLNRLIGWDKYRVAHA